MSPRLLYLLTTLRAPHAFELYRDWIDAQRVAARMSTGRRPLPAAVPPSTMSSQEDRSPGGVAPAQDLLQRGDGRPVYRVGFASSRGPLALDPLSPITPPDAGAP
jgi:hypothetical protein